MTVPDGHHPVMKLYVHIYITINISGKISFFKKFKLLPHAIYLVFVSGPEVQSLRL